MKEQVWFILIVSVLCSNLHSCLPSCVFVSCSVFHCDCAVEGLDYKDRACCESGSDEPSEVCSLNNYEEMETTVRIGLVVGVILGLCITCCCGWGVYKCCNRTKRAPSKVTLVPVAAASTPAPAPPTIPIANTLPVGSVIAPSYATPISNGPVVYGGAPVMMSPSASAPPMNPAFQVRY